jgi:hypothetical protein
MIERKCCSEYTDEYVRLINKYNEDRGGAPLIRCISQHPGFQGVRLNRYVLDTAYLEYRQHYGQFDAPQNE